MTETVIHRLHFIINNTLPCHSQFILQAVGWRFSTLSSSSSSSTPAAYRSVYLQLGNFTFHVSCYSYKDKFLLSELNWNDVIVLLACNEKYWLGPFQVNPNLQHQILSGKQNVSNNSSRSKKCQDATIGPMWLFYCVETCRGVFMLSCGISSAVEDDARHISTNRGRSKAPNNWQRGQRQVESYGLPFFLMASANFAHK